MVLLLARAVLLPGPKPYRPCQRPVGAVVWRKAVLRHPKVAIAMVSNVNTVKLFCRWHAAIAVPQSCSRHHGEGRRHVWTTYAGRGRTGRSSPASRGQAHFVWPLPDSAPLLWSLLRILRGMLWSGATCHACRYAVIAVVRSRQSRWSETAADAPAFAAGRRSESPVRHYAVRIRFLKTDRMRKREGCTSSSPPSWCREAHEHRVPGLHPSHQNLS